MIFNSDVLIGTIILIIGLGYWSISVVENNNVYVDAVQNEYLFDKGISTMESLATSGKLQDAVLLYYFDNGDEIMENKAIKLLNESINLSSYKLEINGTTILSKNYNDNLNKSIYVVGIVELNRSEGWYVIYGDDNEIHISNERYTDFQNAQMAYINERYDMPVYYSKGVKSLKVKLYVEG